MWSILLLIALSLAEDCDVDANEGDNLSPECNFAGTCYDYGDGGVCICCDTTAEPDLCAGFVPGAWSGDNCDIARYFTQMTWVYLFEGDEVDCVDDGETAALPDLMDQTVVLVSDEYKGTIVTMPCEICTEDEPCDYFDDDDEPVPTSGIMVKFGTDINTYYDPDCGSSTLPEDLIVGCDENFDNGATGYLKISNALGVGDDYSELISELQALMTSTEENGLGWSSTTLSRVHSFKFSSTFKTTQFTRLPTPSPSYVPSSSPTPHPSSYEESTEEPGVCEEYINSVDDIQFLGVGSSCRGNIDPDWTGGQTCASPYIICLPEENTPGNDMMGDAYKSTEHRYTVEECLTECAYDQRCLGVEFVADADTNVGDCNLLETIQIGVEDPSFKYSYNSADTNLDSTQTGGDALCWMKRDFCNPYFEASDLTDVMLNCYCPNTRKGFYTKKVQRTVANSRFCGSDSEEDEKIQKAQANRMFHMCENWCLFETENPEAESWFWDPWQKCWRETYSGTGAHRSFCDRVIRNPDSIEMQFVNDRAENFLSDDCDGEKTPTAQPVELSYFWVLSEAEASCDDACVGEGGWCAEEATAQFLNETEVTTAFSEAGVTCEADNVVTVDSSYDGWALPGYKDSTYCVARQDTLGHLENLDTDCSRELGVQWQRLCACYQ